MNISLVFPPSIYQTKQTMPPLGIAWLAAVLRQNGYNNVFLIDSVINKYTEVQVLDIIKKQDPDIIGFSFGTQNRFFAINLIRLTRLAFKDIPIVVGGPHPTLTADDLLRNIAEINIVVRGEGEYTFLELVKALDNKDDLHNIKGISYRDKNNNIIHNLPRDPIKNLDELPFPARDLLPINEYQQTIPLSTEICTSMISARGCPYSCIYCSTAEQWGHQIRHRSPENIISEVEHLLNNYQLDGVGFFDDVFTMNKMRVIEICRRIIEKKMNLKWWCEARANTIDEELINYMKKAGCVHISMAIESGSDKILKNIKKMITVDQAINATKIIKSAGIKLKLFFMHGLPGETFDDIKKTVFLSRYLQEKYGVDEATQGYTMIYPGTYLEKYAKEIGTLPKNFSWSKYYEEARNYPPLDRCPYIPVFEQPNLSYEQTFRNVKKAKMLYYLQHPIALFKNLFRFRKTIIKWMTTKV